MLVNGNLILGSTILQRSSKIATITYDLIDCVSSNTINTIAINSNYQTTIVSNAAFAYCGVQVMMGTKDITADVYDIYTGTITINKILSNVIIRAETITTFANASWYTVKCVAQSNIMNNEEASFRLSWRLGDTKPLVIGDYTYTVRICDITPNRYQYVDDTERYSNMVLECVELFEQTHQRHTSNNTNYKTSNIRNYYNDTIIPLFPKDLQTILSVVNIDVCYVTSLSSGGVVGYSQDKVFMPSSLELGGTNPYSLGKILQYYEIYLNAARQKKKQGNSSFIEWWSRTGGWITNTDSGRTDTVVGIFSDANGGITAIQRSIAVGNDDAVTNGAATNAKGIPIFWAW